MVKVFDLESHIGTALVVWISARRYGVWSTAMSVAQELQAPRRKQEMAERRSSEGGLSSDLKRGVSERSSQQ